MFSKRSCFEKKHPMLLFEWKKTKNTGETSWLTETSSRQVCEVHYFKTQNKKICDSSSQGNILFIFGRNSEDPLFFNFQDQDIQGGDRRKKKDISRKMISYVTESLQSLNKNETGRKRILLISTGQRRTKDEKISINARIKEDLHKNGFGDRFVDGDNTYFLKSRSFNSICVEIFNDVSTLSNDSMLSGIDSIFDQDLFLRDRDTKCVLWISIPKNFGEYYDIPTFDQLREDAQDYIRNIAQKHGLLVELPDTVYYLSDSDNTHEFLQLIIKVKQSTSKKCTLCGKGDSFKPNLILFCDGCDTCYHQRCLDPVLEKVPEGKWYGECCEEGMHADFEVSEIESADEFEYDIESDDDQSVEIKEEILSFKDRPIPFDDDRDLRSDEESSSSDENSGCSQTLTSSDESSNNFPPSSTYYLKKSLQNSLIEYLGACYPKTTSFGVLTDKIIEPWNVKFNKEEKPFEDVIRDAMEILRPFQKKDYHYCFDYKAFLQIQMLTDNEISRTFIPLPSIDDEDFYQLAESQLQIDIRSFKPVQQSKLLEDRMKEILKEEIFERAKEKDSFESLCNHFDKKHIDFVSKQLNIKLSLSKERTLFLILLTRIEDLLSLGKTCYFLLDRIVSFDRDRLQCEMKWKLFKQTTQISFDIAARFFTSKLGEFFLNSDLGARKESNEKKRDRPPSATKLNSSTGKRVRIF